MREWAFPILDPVSGVIYCFSDNSVSHFAAAQQMINKMAESIETDDQLSALMPTMVEVRSLWSDLYSQEELAVACLSLLPSVFFPSLHELYVLC